MSFKSKSRKSKGKNRQKKKRIDLKMKSWSIEFVKNFSRMEQN